ncbi:hypothetical protein AB1Y20_001728 [Prymnesium parvum]|uniref:RNHCP domain-containing protein n=1 Tax=Prymnesium parvum TaxID=97485 RepID=A0AB34KC11_PRYPA
MGASAANAITSSMVRTTECAGCVRLISGGEPRLAPCGGVDGVPLVLPGRTRLANHLSCTRCGDRERSRPGDRDGDLASLADGERERNAGMSAGGRGGERWERLASAGFGDFPRDGR